MAVTLQLDLPVILPDVPDEEDECVGRLLGALEAREGVEEAHVVAASEEEPAKLCLHYDPDAISLSRIRWEAERSGAHLTDRYGHLLWSVEGIGHVRRARTVGERLRRLDGVIEAEVAPEGPVRVEFDREKIGEPQIRDAIEHQGLRLSERGSERDSEPGADHGAEPEDERGSEREHSHGGVLGERAELIFALSSGATLGLGVLLASLTSAPGAVSLGLYIAAYFFGGFFTLREAVEKIANRQFEIDFLMLVAATGAAVLGAWAEGALLLFLFSLGHSLEGYAMGRARRAIEALAELAPTTAFVRRDGVEQEVPVEELAVGDVVIVRPDARLSADGFVVSGESSVDQSSVTGESVPVDKQPVDDPDAAMESPEGLDAAHRVFAGTINGSGALEIRVTRRSEENTLSRVVELVSEAETQKSPTQRFTDRFERYFVPAVLALVALLLVSPLATGEAFGDSFYRAMAVLVAASPCALAISTPSAVLSAVARAGRGGVLVKGGGPLENLGTLTAYAFDKTGTLTEGKPRLTDVTPYGDADERELLASAVAVERLSGHPLAAAVVRDGAGRLDTDGLPQAQGMESLTGRGVRASLDGEDVYIGKDELFGEATGKDGVPAGIRDEVERLEGEGRTTMIVRRGGRYLGVLGLMDTPRESAAGVMTRLRELGLKRLIMISGDNQRVADAVAGQVGLDEAWGDLLPEDKVGAIKKLRERERQVAMVGDGVNDAPAMANATVGVAMGAAGSDVALETADVALMSDDLSQLTFAGGLARQASRNIKQNLYISLGVVALLVPATVFGLGIGPAVAFHEGSTLIVVANALRLLAYKDKT